MTFVSDLEPKRLWRFFDEILTIPRGSKEEDQIREYVLRTAARLGFTARTDNIGNVVIRKPAASGHEKAPVTILQAHLDMVNEKNSDVEHDFSRDPIQPRREGDYLKATGTTLGADNGIGVAAMLAILEDEAVVHGPLELLFTIDEETGLIGATQLGEGMLEGKRLINLDTEEERIFYVGCAGGGDSNLSLPVQKADVPAGSAALKVQLFGLKGGHSGCDIHLQRGNAAKLLARALHAVAEAQHFNLSLFEGGNKHNAIPREAFATVVLAEHLKADFITALESEFAGIRSEFKPAEPDMALQVADVALPASMLENASSRKVLDLIIALPHGVLAMSYDIPDLVETSTNLAAVKQDDSTVKILMSSRSSVESAKKAIRQRIRATAELAGADVEENNGYPGWKPDLESELLAILTDVHEKVTGVKPEVKAVHAGLECGIIGEKYPGMDMISIGPCIENPHSPDEQVKIPTVQEFWDVLLASLRTLAL